MSINNIKFLALGLVGGAAFLSITIILSAIPWSLSAGDLRDAELTYAATSKQLISVLRNQDVLEMTARENHNRGDRRLYDCLKMEGNCSAANTKNYFKFRQGLDPALPLAGGDLHEPVRIPWNNKCHVTGCPAWEVRTWFKARCPDGAASCDRAESIEVGVSIEKTDSKLEIPAHLDLKSDISLTINVQ